MTPSIIKFILILGYLVVYAQGALVTTYQCTKVDRSDFKLAPFVIDVALDEDAKLLKFFINSKVLSLPSLPRENVLISDVNATTNKYTTMHVDIQFMGKVFVNEDIRFCDALAVKHTEELSSSPRYISSSEKVIQSDYYLSQKKRERNEGRIRRLDSDEDQSISLSTSNTTVENYFSNSTGDLVQCPLYANDSLVIYYEVDISDHYQKLGSYSVNFKVFANDDSSQIIGCNKAYVTPEHSNNLKRVLTISVPVLLLVTGLINFFTIIYSSYQESSNPFLFVASTICNENLLKQLDATTEQIITYFQFALFIGGLDLQYPGFYQPLIGQIRWCALMGFVFIHDSKGNYVERDNIYMTLNLDGLKNLATYSSDLTYDSCWTNFIITFAIWTMISIVAHHLFLILRFIFLCIYRKIVKKDSNSHNTKAITSSVPRANYEFTIKMNFYHILGQVLQNFIVLFGFPFLVLTTFMLRDASTLGHLKYKPIKENIKNNIFSTSVPYEKIFSPNLYFMIENPSDIIGSQSHNVHIFNSTELNFGNYSSTTYVKESGRYVKVPVSSVTIGSILLALWVGLAMFFVFNYLIAIKNWRIRTNKNVSHLYTSMKSILMWGFCYCKYHPDKVNFVTIDLLGLLFKLLIIGCLQSFGSVQVALLIVIESFSLILLFTLKPYFVGLTWTTTRWVLPVARLLVTILCIPYIKSLEIGELTRTYVAFIQLVVHVIVAIIFTVHLLYCLIITMLSIIRERHDKVKYEKCIRNHAYNSIDEFNTHFEYHPVANPIPSFVPHDNKFESINSCHFNSLNLPQELENNEIDDTCVDVEDEDPYYRAGSEKQLRKIHYEPIDEIMFRKIPTTGSNSNLAKCNDVESIVGSLNSGAQSVISFERQQVFSNIRKRNNDYTFREGDLIYRKYFTDESIDPEIKALWASRNNWNLCHSPHSKEKVHKDDRNENRDKQTNANERFSLSNIHLFGDIKNMLLFGGSLQKKKDERSFLVSRPKKLIVKSYSSVNNSLDQRYKNLSDSSSPSTQTLNEK